MARAYIALGSNLQDPLQQVLLATDRLQNLSKTIVTEISSCYQSEPLPLAMAPKLHQADYINRVVAFETELLPLQLLDALQEIEKQQGRERVVRWGPRTIDLDILLYDNQIISSPRLTIPHIGLKERAFFLYPLAEIAPDLILPDGDSVLALKSKCASTIQLIKEGS